MASEDSGDKVAKELNKLNRILVTVLVSGIAFAIDSEGAELDEDGRKKLEKMGAKLIAISKE